MRAFAFLVGVVLIAGCTASYSHTDITDVSSPNLPGALDQQHVALTVGGVLTAHISPFNSDGHAMIGNAVSLDPTIASVSRTTTDSTYAFVGVSAGSTSIQLLADGVVVGVIPTTVTDQVAAQ